RFARLPEPLKDEMMSVENSERIFEAGKKFGLTIEQIGFLAEEAGYVVLGLTHPNDFVGRLKDHLRVDEEKAKTIAQQINHQVFFPLREILKTTHQFELTQEQIQASPPPIPAIPHAQPIIPKTPPTPQSDIRPIGRPTPVISVPSVPPAKNPPQMPTPPAPIVKPPVIPTPASQPLAPPIPPLSVQKVQKIPTPIPPPPPRAHEPIVLPTINPPLPPVNRQTPPLLTHPNLPPIEEKKYNQPVPSIIQTKPGPIGQPIIIPPTPKLIDNIKPKEPLLPSAPALQQPALSEHTLNPSPTQQNIDKTTQPPAPPSQIMQEKLLDETQRAKTPLRPEVERIKESLFAPPSAPAQSTPNTQPVPQPKTQIPQPPTESSPKPPTPSSYATRDPYREPIE
ncbi:MAG: hypothetical protein AAB975_03130, partial [Patescibacteria group bacterium]